MRHLCRLLGPMAMVVATTAGCGGSATTSTGSTSTLTTSTGQSQREVFPLTVTRTGGVAGFRDMLVVTADGLVSVSRKGRQSRQCRLTPAVIRQLTTAASAVPWSRINPADTHASFPDDMVSTMVSPAGGPVRLGDPQAGTTGQLVLKLLNDVSAPAASRLCRPV